MKARLDAAARVLSNPSALKLERLGSQVSGRAALSANGRFVVYREEGRLVKHDRQTGTTEPLNLEPNKGVSDLSVSDDGERVVFSSSATNLVAGDTNDKPDIFVHEKGQTRRINVGPNGEEANNWSYNPRMRGDRVVFGSSADNLVEGDTNGQADVFVHDLSTGKTVLASCTAEGQQGNDRSEEGDISADGEWLVFRSMATNLVEGAGHNSHIFLKNLVSGEVEHVSKGANAHSSHPRISADGQVVAFTSHADNLDPTRRRSYSQEVFVARDGRTRCVSYIEGGKPLRSASSLSLDEAGERLLFRADRGKERGGIYSVDLSTGQTRILSDTEAIETHHPVLSGNGELVAFTAEKLVLLENRSLEERLAEASAETDVLELEFHQDALQVGDFEIPFS